MERSSRGCGVFWVSLDVHSCGQVRTHGYAGSCASAHDYRQSSHTFLVQAKHNMPQRLLEISTS